MKKKALVLALVFSAVVLVSVSTEAGVSVSNGMWLWNGLSLSTTGLDFTTISHHRLGK